MDRIPSPAVLNIFLVYSKFKGWRLSIGNEGYNIKSSNHRVILALLAFMERDFKEMDCLVSQISEHHRFPYTPFIIAGFKHGSPHWVTCALDWLEYLHDEDYANHENWLNEISENKNKYSQHLRHKAQKVSARLKQNSGT